MVTLERVAINYDDATRYGFKDEAGKAPLCTPVILDGPRSYFSTLPLRTIVCDLRQTGIPADITGHAGTVCCNHLMYGTLHHIQTKTTRKSASSRIAVVGWVHLPTLPETAAIEHNLGMPSRTSDLSTKAVLSIVDSIVADIKAGGGDIDIPSTSRLLI